MWIEEAKNGYHFYEKYKDPMTGKWRRVCVTRETKTKAAQRAAQRKLDEKIEALKNKDIVGDMTVSELVRAYLSAQRTEVKQQTVVGNKHHLATVERLLGGDTKVSMLSAPFVRECLSDAPVTFNERLKRFKAMMRWAYRNDYVEDIGWLEKLVRMKEPPVREKNADKYLEHDEITALLEGMETERWRLLTEFLILSGLRVGEAIALKDEDVTDVISVTKTYSHMINGVSSTKTEASEREVFVQDELADCIKRIRLFRKEDMMREGYRTDIFLPSRTGTYINYMSYAKYIRENSEAILKRRIRPHALRHTHVAMLAEAGLTLQEIARRVGHSNSKITEEVYFHVTQKLKERDNERIKAVKII